MQKCTEPLVQQGAGVLCAYGISMFQLSTHPVTVSKGDQAETKRGAVAA